jgi:hypothetical protein
MYVRTQRLYLNPLKTNKYPEQHFSFIIHWYWNKPQLCLPARLADKTSLEMKTRREPWENYTNRAKHKYSGQNVSMWEHFFLANAPRYPKDHCFFSRFRLRPPVLVVRVVLRRRQVWSTSEMLRLPLIQFSSYWAVYAPCLGYKTNQVIVHIWRNCCLLRDPYKTQKYPLWVEFRLF